MFYIFLNYNKKFMENKMINNKQTLITFVKILAFKDFRLLIEFARKSHEVSHKSLKSLLENYNDSNEFLSQFSSYKINLSSALYLIYYAIPQIPTKHKQQFLFEMENCLFI